MLHSNGTDIIVGFKDKTLKVDNKHDAKKIVKALSNNPKMTAFCLSGNTIGVEGAEEIGSKLTKHKELTRCLFSDMFTGRTADEIGPALKFISVGIMASGAQLTELDLSDNAFGPRGVVGVTDLLSSPTCYTLKILRMNNQGLGHAGAKYLADALSKGIKMSNGKGLKLQHFSAGRNRLENVGACLLADVFSKMGSLQELHLYQNGIGIHGPEGIKALVSAISRNTKMQILNLSDNSLTATGGIEVAKILSSLPDLKELILDDCLIRSRGCRALARELERPYVVPQLSRLSLYGNEIKRSAGISLAISLASKPDLQSLSLNANDFGPSGIESVLGALRSVNLIPAIEATAPALEDCEDDEDDENGTGEMDACHRAFNEDQGEDGEDSDDEEEEVEAGDVEEEYEFEEGTYEDDEDDADLDYDESEEHYDSEAEDRENSFTTVKERPARPLNEASDPMLKTATNTTDSTGGFSFLSCMSSLQTSQSAPKPVTPVGGGLFAGLSNPKSPGDGIFGQAASIVGNQVGRFPFGTPGGIGLFTPPNSGSATPSLGRVSGIFATPKLGSVTPTSTQVAFDEGSALVALNAALANTEDDNLVKALISILPPNFTGTSPWSHKIDAASCPESVVRLAFRLVHSCESSPASQQLASNLLLSACTADASSDDVLVPPRSRAVNRILLHLGSIKADRSESMDRRVASELPRCLPANAQLVSALLDRHGGKLSREVRATLALLISQQKAKKNQQQTGTKAEANAELDSLLDALEGKLSALSVS